ncbi:hypothetical protein [Thomasclavelia cocleata]|uniref:hypothetical protein n=1 Tax=Thomasclavelia cocleata TaxID=69824 RepID=UPI00242F31C0|nr:hypothetical protein [Thomasclavelia cocleata]
MSYDEEYNDLYEQVMGEVLNDISETKEETDFFKISFKKDMLTTIFKETVHEYCRGLIKDIKNEIINSIKKDLIDNKFDYVLKKELQTSIKEQTDLILNNFMDRDITVSDGYWNTKTVKCRDLIEDDIEKFLKNDLKGNFQNFINETVDYRTKKKIDQYEESLRRETRNKIDDMFNQTTRNALSEQLFYILSQNETYQKIQSGINSLIENKDD